MTLSNDEQALLPRNARQASAWITVLEACTIEHRLFLRENDWVIALPITAWDHALREIDAVEQEGELGANFTPHAPDLEATRRSLSSWWVAAFVCAFYVWLGPYEGGNAVLVYAASDSEAFATGEWWRPVTALTVHSGPVHLAGNLACLALLGAIVCDCLGAGLAWVVILGAGILGNSLACLLHGEGYSSVGASTSCFGALGALTMDRLLYRFESSPQPSREWKTIILPLGAGIALVGLLGTGPRSDLAAHAFGFFAGAIFVVPVRRLVPQPLCVDRILQMAALALVLSAWRCAFAKSALY